MREEKELDLVDLVIEFLERKIKSFPPLNEIRLEEIDTLQAFRKVIKCLKENKK